MKNQLTEERMEEFRNAIRGSINTMNDNEDLTKIIGKMKEELTKEEQDKFILSGILVNTQEQSSLQRQILAVAGIVLLQSALSLGIIFALTELNREDTKKAITILVSAYNNNEMSMEEVESYLEDLGNEKWMRKHINKLLIGEKIPVKIKKTKTVKATEATEATE